MANEGDGGPKNLPAMPEQAHELVEEFQMILLREGKTAIPRFLETHGLKIPHLPYLPLPGIEIPGIDMEGWLMPGLAVSSGGSFGSTFYRHGFGRNDRYQCDSNRL